MRTRCWDADQRAVAATCDQIRECTKLRSCFPQTWGRTSAGTGFHVKCLSAIACNTAVRHIMFRRVITTEVATTGMEANKKDMNAVSLPEISSVSSSGLNEAASTRAFPFDAMKGRLY